MSMKTSSRPWSWVTTARNSSRANLGRRTELRDRPHRLGQGGRNRRRPGGRGRRLQIRGPGGLERVGEDEPPPKTGDTVEVLLSRAWKTRPARSSCPARKLHRMRVGNGDHAPPRGRRRQRQGHPQNQGWAAGRYRCQRLLLRQLWVDIRRLVRHRRLHRPRNRVHDPQDR